MDNKFKDSAQQDFYRIFNSQVEKYVKDGATKPQAISVVCKKFNLSPYKIINTYYSDIKQEDLQTYKDIKTEEGSFVTLKNDSNQNHYEVININNKDAIVLRNTNNNEEITASENEITPVITENKMNKLNEAQYNISINGLETQDAATLSQMLNLASQAESMGGSMIAPNGMQSDMAVNPMPMDMDSGMPMDMNEPSPTDMGVDMPMDNGLEEPVVDDIEFDEELPTDTSIDGEINTDINVPEENSEMEISSDINVPESPIDNDMSSDMSMDDMIDNGMYDNIMDESFDYDALIKEAMEAAQKETVKETEEIIPGEDFIDDKGQLEGEQEEYATEISVAYNGNFDSLKEEIQNGSITDEEAISALLDMGEASDDEEAMDIINGIKEDFAWQYNEYQDDVALANDSYGDEEDYDFDSEITEALKAAGIELNETENDEDSVLGNEEVENSEPGMDESFDYDKEIAEALRIAGVKLNENEEPEDWEYQDDDSHDNAELDQIKDLFMSGDFDDEQIKYDLIHAGFASSDEEAQEIIDEWSKNDIIFDGESEESTDFDSEIAEALRIAGVELNEEVTDGPEIVDQKTLYINKDKEKEGQEPEYTEVDTTTFGKDASEGMKKSMTFEAAVNTNKIKSIYETAKSMYAKKDTSEWLSLDRRYVEKLIREGVGYEKASKMILEAKKGK